MKKGPSNHVPRLIVDEFEKIKTAQCQPSSKSSYSIDQNQRAKKTRIEEAKCWHCRRLFPAEKIPMHEKICAVMRKPEYEMMQSVREDRKGERKRQDKPECNYDYYPIENEVQFRENKNDVNKAKRPMSAMNKKIDTKPKLEIRLEREDSKLKKATSTSKLKEQFRNSRHISKEKGEKNKQPKYENVYLKSIGIEKKHPLSIGQNNASNASKLKKKNVNTVQKFKKEQRSIEEKSLRRPESRSKKEEKPVLREKRRVEQSDNEEEQEMIRRKHKEQARLDPPQITTQKLREMVREKLREQKEEDREKRRQPMQSQRRQNIREPARQQVRQQRPMRTQARNERQATERQPRQPRPNRNQPRNRNFQRYPRRAASRNQQPGPLFNLVSQTISNQLQMINNQFSVMSNIFQNFSNYVNINIESYPNHYQFTAHELNTSSEYNSDSSYSNSSDYDDYYEESQPQGMDEEQLNSIQDKRYRVQQHGQNQCTICLAELKNGDIIKQLFCDHLFHSQCIEQWLRRKSACPVCRDQLG